VRNVALNIHLALFTIARRRQSDYTENAWTSLVFRDGLELFRPFAGRITALKQDNDFHSFDLYSNPAAGKARPEACADAFHIPLRFIFLEFELSARHASRLCIWNN